MPYDADKFRALVHYICWKAQDPTKLGATKLNKVLWFVDTIAFVKHGHSVTGAPYIKRQFGPVPHPVLPELEYLRAAGALAIRETEYFGKPKREFFALTEPDISAFDPTDISLADSVIDIICNKHSAVSISELTHDEIWQMAEIGEELPHYAVLAGNVGELTEEDMEWARREAGEVQAAEAQAC